MNITLALGGGGARGNSRIDVIRRLEKEGFKIHGVAGRVSAESLPSSMCLEPHPIKSKTCSLHSTKDIIGHGEGEGPSLLGLTGAVIYTAVMSLGLCYTLQAWAQRHTPPSDAALILSLVSVFLRSSLAG